LLSCEKKRGAAYLGWTRQSPYKLMNKVKIVLGWVPTKITVLQRLELRVLFFGDIKGWAVCGASLQSIRIESELGFCASTSDWM
jgi:hypothetical protein